MENQPSREPNNALAGAMRELQEMRGANTALRSFGKDAPPPMSPEEAAANFAASTGILVDTEGNVVAPGAPGSDMLQRRADIAASLAMEDVGEGGAAPPAHEAGEPSPGFVRGLQGLPVVATVVPEPPPAPPLLNGVDLDQLVVLVDGEFYPMDEAEVQAATIFTDTVLSRVVADRRAARLIAAGVKVTRGEPNGAEANPVPSVPAGAKPARVRRTPRKK